MVTPDKNIVDDKQIEKTTKDSSCKSLDSKLLAKNVVLDHNVKVDHEVLLNPSLPRNLIEGNHFDTWWIRQVNSKKYSTCLIEGHKITTDMKLIFVNILLTLVAFKHYQK